MVQFRSHIHPAFYKSLLLLFLNNYGAYDTPTELFPLASHHACRCFAFSHFSLFFRVYHARISHGGELCVHLISINMTVYIFKSFE